MGHCATVGQSHDVVVHGGHCEIDAGGHVEHWQTEQPGTDVIANDVVDVVVVVDMGSNANPVVED